MVILLKYTLIEHTTFKYFKNEFENSSILSIQYSLDSGYEIIDISELPKVCDKLVIDSFDEFPLRLLKGICMNVLHLSCFIDYTFESFEVLYNLEENNVSIHVHRDGKNFESWYMNEKRMMTIRNIIG